MTESAAALSRVRGGAGGASGTFPAGLAGLFLRWVVAFELGMALVCLLAIWFPAGWPMGHAYRVAAVEAIAKGVAERNGQHGL